MVLVFIILSENFCFSPTFDSGPYVLNCNPPPITNMYVKFDGTYILCTSRLLGELPCICLIKIQAFELGCGQVSYFSVSCLCAVCLLPRGSTLNETHTMLKSFQIYNPLQSSSDFQNISTYNRPVCEENLESCVLTILQHSS